MPSFRVSEAVTNAQVDAAARSTRSLWCQADAKAHAFTFVVNVHPAGERTVRLDRVRTPGLLAHQQRVSNLIGSKSPARNVKWQHDHAIFISHDAAPRHHHDTR